MNRWFLSNHLRGDVYVAGTFEPGTAHIIYTPPPRAILTRKKLPQPLLQAMTVSPTTHFIVMAISRVRYLFTGTMS